MGSKLQKVFPSSSQRKKHDMKIQLNGMETPACEYGCGLIAVTQLKTGRWCCGEGSDDCPEVRRMIKETMKKVGNISSHGGRRAGAGRPKTGQSKQKISVSVDQQTWEKALKKWREKGSRLIDKLLRDYVANARS